MFDVYIEKIYIILIVFFLFPCFSCKENKMDFPEEDASVQDDSKQIKDSGLIEGNKKLDLKINTKDIGKNLDLTSDATNGDSAIEDPINGDWFFCEDSLCSTLKSKGLRFNKNNSWTYLYSSQQPFKDGNGYCETTANKKLVGTYTRWDSTYIDLKIPDYGITRVSFKINGDIAEWVLDNEYRYLKRISIEKSTSSCENNSPWVCPIDGSTSSCERYWTCDNGIFNIQCKLKQNSSTNYICNCFSKGNITSTFELDSNPCNSTFLNSFESTNLANAMCKFAGKSWQVTCFWCD